MGLVRPMQMQMVMAMAMAIAVIELRLRWRSAVDKLGRTGNACIDRSPRAEAGAEANAEAQAEAEAGWSTADVS